MKTLKGSLLGVRHCALPHVGLQISLAGRFRGNLSIREGKPFAQGHPAKKWQSQDSRLILLTALALLSPAAACTAGMIPTSR